MEILKKRHPRIALNQVKKIGCAATADDSPSTSLIKPDCESQAMTSLRPECCQAPYLIHLLKQLGWRIRSKWRQFRMRRRRCNTRLNYDDRSYAQNFDEGRRSVHDRRSPLAP